MSSSESDRPLLSIIVPVLREPRAIRRCLRTLSRCRRIDECEVIVVDGDGGSTGTPTGILPVSVVLSDRGRGRQLHAGAVRARAPRLAFLHVDTIPPTDFVVRIVDALASARAGAFDLSIPSPNPFVRLVGLVGRLRSRLTRIPYGDQLHFLTAELYRSVGGYRPVPIMEDVLLMDRIRQRRIRIAFLTPAVRTSDRRWRVEGPLRGTLRNWRLMGALRRGVDPAELARRYRPHAELDRPRERVIVFHRALVRGSVKTRLAASIGDDRALAVYRAILEDLDHAVGDFPAVAPYIAAPQGAAPHADSAAGEDFFGDSRVQRGGTLGERMVGALADAFAEGCTKVVLVGSDLPGLRLDHLTRALRRLARADAVVGPAGDGGYYLIGFRRGAWDPAAILADPDARRPIEPLMAALRRSGRSVSRMAALRDIDTADDLAWHAAHPYACGPRLRALLARADGAELRG